MSRNEHSRGLATLPGPAVATEDGAWLALLKSPPEVQVSALAERGLGRTAVLFLQNVCESRCFFCANAGVTDARVSGLSPSSEIERWLDAASRARPELVCVAGNEPTLHPSFDAILERLHGMGARAQIMTSGLSLAPERAASWAERGVSSVAVPLYAVEAETHDAVVGTPGAHARVLAGLDAARRAGLRAHVHTLALSRTLPELATLAALVRERWGERLAVGIARPKPGVWGWDEGAPRFEAVARAVADLDVSLLGFPLCVAPERPRGGAHVVEVYFRTTHMTFAPPCAECPARSACPGILPAELARGFTPRPRAVL